MMARLRGDMGCSANMFDEQPPKYPTESTACHLPAMTPIAEKLTEAGFTREQVLTVARVIGEILDDKRVEENRKARDRMKRIRGERSRAEGEKAVDRQGNPYAFESGVIRLNERDFERWRKAYSDIDIVSEITPGVAKWAAQQQNWFSAVSGLLAKKNRQARDRRIEAEARGRYSGNNGTSRVIF